MTTYINKVSFIVIYLPLTLTVDSGIILIVLPTSAVVLFSVGYTRYSMSNGLQIVRVSCTKIVPVQKRTTVLATHALMTSIDALDAPVAWTLAKT